MATCAIINQANNSKSYPKIGYAAGALTAGFTSVISKMLSGSRLPPPTFRVQVTRPLCVTDMMRLATEQAFSCRVASTMWRWPTCGETGRLVSQRANSLHCVLTAGQAQLTLHRVTIHGTFSTPILMQSYGSSDSSISFPPSSSDDMKTLGILSANAGQGVLSAKPVTPKLTYVTYFVLKRAALIATEMAS